MIAGMKTAGDLRRKVTPLRRMRGSLPQYQVADIVGITESHLSLLESGRRRPSDEVAKKLAKFYETTVTELFP